MLRKNTKAYFPEPYNLEMMTISQRKFLQVHQGQFVLAEVALRFWSQTNTFFQWFVLPLYTFNQRHWALEQALIQLWQPRLNFPFISQIFSPRNGLKPRLPYSHKRQFGVKSLWRKLRYRHTPAVISNLLFQNRVHLWSLLQDLGSNTVIESHTGNSREATISTTFCLDFHCKHTSSELDIKTHLSLMTFAVWTDFFLVKTPVFLVISTQRIVIKLLAPLNWMDITFFPPKKQKTAVSTEQWKNLSCLGFFSGMDWPTTAIWGFNQPGWLVESQAD